jgi:hypothetical protein
MPHKEHGEDRSVEKKGPQVSVLVSGITVKTRSIIPALQPVGLSMYGVCHVISGRRYVERNLYLALSSNTIME